MKDQLVSRDERTVVVENASYRLAYLVMSFGLLASVAYRSFALQQSGWDLLALVIVGGATATLYQGFNHVLSRRWLVVTAVVFAVAAVLAIALVTLLR